MIQNEKEIRGGGAEDSPAARATVARARTLANMLAMTRLGSFVRGGAFSLFERICSANLKSESARTKTTNESR